MIISLNDFSVWLDRRTADLIQQREIPLVDAVLGTRLQVPTLDGEVKLTVPPGTQPDAVLRLAGKGLPEYGSSRRGDLYLSLQVTVPKQLSDEEKALYEQLRRLRSSRGEPV